MTKKIIYLFAFVCLVACSKSKDPLRADNSITLFQLQINGEVVSGTINQSAKTIVFDLVDADLSSLRPTIAFSEGATINPSPTTPQNFNQEVKYTVTAENGNPNRYTVSVNNKISSSENLITQFQLPINGENIDGEINQTDNTVTFDLVGANLTSLTPIIKISENATLSPAMNSSLNFNEEVSFKVTAENGDERSYSIIVNNRMLNTESDILSFTVGLNGEDIEARIDNDLNEVAFETGSFNISRLLPEIVVSENATISPASGEAVDFTNPVSYTVTSENGEQTEYRVSINEAYNINAVTAYGPRWGAQKLYTRAKLSIVTQFLNPEISGAELFLSDGANRIDLPLEEITSYENQRIINYHVTTEIPEDAITSEDYRIFYKLNELEVESEFLIDVLAEGSPKITNINQDSYGWGDTLIVTGENLTPLIGVPSNGNFYVFHPHGNIETELNPEKTEYRLLLEGPPSFTNDAFFFYSGDTRDVIFINNASDRRMGEQIRINVE